VEDYDPEGDGKESEDQLQNAIDGNLTTVWDTESYRNGLGALKKGVGLYVDAGSPIAARQLAVVTSTPGYQAEVFGASGSKPPRDIGGWTKISARTEVKEDTPIDLDTARKDFRYYLLWVVALPPGNKADVRELELRR